MNVRKYLWYTHSGMITPNAVPNNNPVPTQDIFERCSSVDVVMMSSRRLAQKNKYTLEKENDSGSTPMPKEVAPKSPDITSKESKDDIAGHDAKGEVQNFQASIYKY